MSPEKKIVILLKLYCTNCQSIFEYIINKFVKTSADVIYTDFSNIGEKASDIKANISKHIDI